MPTNVDFIPPTRRAHGHSHVHRMIGSLPPAAIGESLALWAKLKKGDAASWAEFQDLIAAAAHGEPESGQTLAALLSVAATHEIPCCASCARGQVCESRQPKQQAPSPANKTAIGACGCANRPLVGFCCP